MNILLIAYYYPPIDSVGSLRPARMAKYLESKGHNVRVLTASYSGVNKIEGRIIRIKDPGYNNCRKGIRKLKWFLNRVRTEILNISGRYSSIFDGWQRNILLYSDLIKDRAQPDLIISTYPPVETLEAGVALSAEYGVPFISDFRDGLMMDPIEIKSISRFRSVRSHYEVMEAATVGFSGAVITFSEPYTEYLKKKYNKKEVYTVLNGYDEDEYAGLPEGNFLEKREWNIVFTGRIGLSYAENDITSFVNAVRMLSRTHSGLTDKVRFHFAGELTGKERDRMKDLLEAGIFRYYGNVTRTTALCMQREADLFLILSQRDRRSAIPLKYYEYVYWSKPVIALAKGSFLEERIGADGTGICLDPGDEEGMVTFFRELLSSPEKLLQRFSDLQNIEKYSIREQFARIDDILEII